MPRRRASLADYNIATKAYGMGVRVRDSRCPGCTHRSLVRELPPEGPIACLCARLKMGCECDWSG